MINRPLRLFSGAFTALFVALLCYLLSAVSSGMLTLTSALNKCKNGPFLELRENAIPLSYKCLYRDGTSEQLVSPLLNPLLVLLLATSLILFFLGLRASLNSRDRTSIPGGHADDRK